MRIIGGLYRGKNLISPKNDAIRPTSDMAREMLFNILYSKLEKNWNELTWLDVFTGSGAVGLEAISRGVKQATLIDLDISSAAKNIALFPSEQKKIKLIKASATKLSVANEAFDIIFLDAPYQKNLSEPAIKSLLQQGWIKDDSIIIIELAKDEEFLTPSELEKIDNRSRGISQFLFFVKKSH